MSRSSIALVDLRAFVTLVVLAFLPVFADRASPPPAAHPFDRAPYPGRTLRIVDGQRWFGFDPFGAWQDAGPMAPAFFLSGLFGLFVLSSLARRRHATEHHIRRHAPRVKTCLTSGLSEVELP